MLGVILLYDRQWDRSKEEFEVALRLNPNDADAWAEFADLKSFEGRGVEATACIEKALRLNPHPPGYYFWQLGFAQYIAEQYEVAAQTLAESDSSADQQAATASTQKLH